MDQALKDSFSDQNQRLICLFLFACKYNAAQIHRYFAKVLHRSALTDRTVRRWCERFASGNFDVENHRGEGHTSTAEAESRVVAIEGAFEESRARSVRMLSAKLGIPRTTCHEIITKTLKMKKLHKKWVPHELTPTQK